LFFVRQFLFLYLSRRSRAAVRNSGLNQFCRAKFFVTPDKCRARKIRKGIYKKHKPPQQQKNFLFPPEWMKFFCCWGGFLLWKKNVDNFI